MCKTIRSESYTETTHEENLRACLVGRKIMFIGNVIPRKMISGKMNANRFVIPCMENTKKDSKFVLIN